MQIKFIDQEYKKQHNMQSDYRGVRFKVKDCAIDARIYKSILLNKQSENDEGISTFNFSICAYSSHPQGVEKVHTRHYNSHAELSLLMHFGHCLFHLSFLNISISTYRNYTSQFIPDLPIIVKFDYHRYVRGTCRYMQVCTFMYLIIGFSLQVNDFYCICRCLHLHYIITMAILNHCRLTNINANDDE